VTLDDFPVFSGRLIAAQEMLDGAPLSEARLTLTFELLADLALHPVLAALDTLMRTRTFTKLPLPGEIREVVVGRLDDRIEQAWVLCRQAMRQAGAYSSLATDDPALGETILAVFDSWPQACGADLSPEMWSSTRKQFGRVYRMFEQRGLTGHRYLPGLVERENAGHSEWTRYVPLVVIGAHAVEQLRGDEAERYRAALQTAPAQRPATRELMPMERLAAVTLEATHLDG
jgi:hypothetical protein